MYILGISNGYVATATLIKDGHVIASVSEERFNGQKSYNGFPKHAIEWCLRQANISGAELNLVTTPYQLRPPIPIADDLSILHASNRLYQLTGQMVTFSSSLRHLFRRLRYRLPFLRPLGQWLYRIAAQLLGAYHTRVYRQYIAQFLGIAPEKVMAYDHHLSHAASAYYASPFNQERALVLTLDGEGDNYCASVNVFEKDHYEILARTPREFSLGYVYGHVTKFLGMKPHEHEYKVMGLAPYADQKDVDRVYQKIKSVVILDPRDSLRFWMPINAQDFDLYLNQRLRETRFDQLAGAFQRLVEEKTAQWVQAAIQRTGLSTVILSGGVFMNVKANQKIAELPEVKKLFVLPSCSDETAPLGSCYLAHQDLRRTQSTLPPIPSIRQIYWGPKFNREEIENALDAIHAKQKYQIKWIDPIEPSIAQLLANGAIVARLAGRMEFGARALGNRSILADPRNPQVVNVLNEVIKKRDFWMPFTPSILAERAEDYLHLTHNIDPYYMIIAFDATEKGRQDLAATLHPYDFTARPQIVLEDWNPSYYQILKEFEQLTGVGGVLNTSFNLHGYPIVLGPKQALEVFEKSGLKYLVLENYLIRKKDVANPSRF